MVSAIVKKVYAESRTQSREDLDAQIAPMVGRKLKSAAEEKAAATGRTALALIEAGWTADRVAAELVRRSMAAAENFKSERPQPQQQTVGLKRRKTPAEKTQARKMRRQRQSEKKQEKKKVEEKDRDEERWNEMSWTFVEDAAVKKAVAWREERESLRAWRRVREGARELGRVRRARKVGEEEAWEEAKGPTEEPTAKPEEPVEHGGWGERLVWNDQLEQSGAELEEDLDWCEVVAAIKMMQKGINNVARGATVIEKNPLFAKMQDTERVVGPVTASVASVGATERVQGDTTEEKVAKAADAETVRGEEMKMSEQIGDNRTDWRLIQFGGVSGIA